MIHQTINLITMNVNRLGQGVSKFLTAPLLTDRRAAANI
jgi:hypothetical protein